jgi:tetratricopeptide (TPR) repeat protein
MRGAGPFLLRLLLFVALVCPRVATGQAARDSVEYARAERLFWRADTLSRLPNREQSQQAIALWQEAASIYARGHHSIDVALSFHRIARLYDTFGDGDSALVYYAQTLPIWREIGHRANEGTTLNNMGVAHHTLGRNDSALVYLTQALPLRREAGASSGEAQTLYNIGTAQSRLGRPDSAVAYYAQALSIRRDLGNRAEEAWTLESIGRVLSNSGQPDSALFYYIRALRIYREVGDRRAEANALNGIGAMHRDLGRPYSALAHYALSIVIRREVGDQKGEAESLNNIGAVQSDLGRADSAVAYYARALPILRAVGNRSGEAATRGNIGTVQFGLGRSDSALVYYAQALRITRDIRDRAGEATTLNNLGLVFSRIGEADSALANFMLALAIEREIGNNEATTLSNIGVLQSRLGRPDSALVYYQRALAIEERAANRAGAATSLNNIGTVQDELGRPAEALPYYLRALQIHREVGNIRHEATTLENIGNYFLLSAGDRSPRAAAAAFDSAAALHARVRRRAGGDANAVSVSEISGSTFTFWSNAWRLVAEEATVEGDSAAAAQAVSSSLAAAERGRAQALRDLLDRGGDRGAAGVAAADTIAGADLAAEASRLLAPLRQSRTALLYYLADGDTLRAWFLGTDGALKALSPIVQRNAELIDKIGTALVQIGAGEAVTMRRRGEAAPVTRSDLTGSDLVGDLDPAAADAALLALGASVFPEGLEALLPPGVELAIVPNGVLGQVPFAALTLAHDTLPLGLRNAIRYAPSLRALVAESTARPDPETGTEEVHLRALVVGNPEMPRVQGRDGSWQQLSQLAGAAMEGAWVATRLGAPLLTGAAATEQVVRDMMPAASIIHLATHGLAYGTENRVRSSYVALTPGAGHDGFLTLGELLDDDSIRLSADLIVLSACQTGLGETRQAEGTIGLQRGLLAKGARSVLVSLWSVDDAATELLMQRFYTHWLGPDNSPVVGKAEALRRAQADVRAVPSFYDPRYWAAFQVVGGQ